LSLPLLMAVLLVSAPTVGFAGGERGGAGVAGPALDCEDVENDFDEWGRDIVAWRQRPDGTRERVPVEELLELVYYSEANSVTIKEARRRFGIQDASGVFQRRLWNELGDRFAGMWIQHEPVFGVFVAALPGDMAQVKELLEAEAFCGDAELVEARSTIADLRSLTARVREASPVRIGTGIGVHGKVYKARAYVAGGASRQRLEKALAEAGLFPNPDLVVVTVAGLDETLPGPGLDPDPGPGGDRTPAPSLRAPQRRAGPDRYATAVEISKGLFSPGVDVAYVATGATYPDVLAGGAASGGDGPILLVAEDSIPEAAAAELKRLKPKRVVVLGGEAAVSQAVLSALQGYTSREVTRLSGPDRYSTAAAVSAEHFDPGVEVAFVATGEDFPDALAAGPAAAELGGPILLTQKDKLPAATTSELKRLQPKSIVILGGTAVVSSSVESTLRGYTSGETTRLSGPDRYSTAAAVSGHVFKPGVPFAYVATGEGFPDALAGGAAGALAGAPVLLVKKDSIPEATSAELERLQPKSIVVIGGEAAVSETERNALAAYGR